ncbi:uncharacterized protein LOC143582054 [Bidens hawaiensis]|uniref:uncharacterized protein LOC143582054 n=1 Tax=Bidens hawaiensis TaxID=980011 RepID=UPI00404A0E5B
MIFADDIVLVAERKLDLNLRLEEWRAALERKGLRISLSKTEYLHCDFSGVNDDEKIQITIEDQVVPQVTKFKYLGSFIQSDGEIDSDVAHHVQVGWSKWRVDTGILCDRRFPTSLKDCWAIKKSHACKLEVAEKKMLRWMCGHTRLDRIRNDVFRERLGVAKISGKIREGRLRWFRHVKRGEMTAPVRSIEIINIERRRVRGGPKMTWAERIKHDLLDLHLSEDMVEDRNSWRRKINAKDFKEKCRALTRIIIGGYSLPYSK